MSATICDIRVDRETPGRLRFEIWFRGPNGVSTGYSAVFAIGSNWTESVAALEEMKQGIVGLLSERQDRENGGNIS